MPKGNPSPIQTEEFKARQFARADESGEPLSEKAIGVKLPVSVDAAIRSSFASPQEKGAWLRRVITEAAQQELMNEPNDAA